MLLFAVGPVVLLAGVLATPRAVEAVSPGPSVSIVDGAYKPPTLTITQHTTVFWHNDGSKAHTVTADDGSFDSGALNPGDAFGNVFDTAGTFAYHDANDPSGMRGTITVTPVAATPVPTGPTPPPGTLPPDFHTPVPAASDTPPATTATASAPPPSGTSGQASSDLLLVGGLLLIGVLGVGVIVALRRRSA